MVDAEGEWTWRRFADLRPGDRVPLALGQLIGTPNDVALPPLSEKMAWAGEHHVARSRHDVRTSSRSSSATSWATVRCTPRLALLRDRRRPRRGRSPRTSWQGAVRHSGADRRRARATSASSSTRCDSSSGGRPAALPSTGPTRATAARATCRTSLTLCCTRTIPSVYRAFLRGLFEADGTVTVGLPIVDHRATERFADEVQTLMLALGFVTTRSHHVSGTRLAAARRAATEP